MNKQLEAEITKKDLLLKEATSKKAKASKAPYMRGLTNVDDYLEDAIRNEVPQESAGQKSAFVFHNPIQSSMDADAEQTPSPPAFK